MEHTFSYFFLSYFYHSLKHETMPWLRENKWSRNHSWSRIMILIRNEFLNNAPTMCHKCFCTWVSNLGPNKVGIGPKKVCFILFLHFFPLYPLPFTTSTWANLIIFWNNFWLIVLPVISWFIFLGQSVNLLLQLLCLSLN